MKGNIYIKMVWTLISMSEMRVYRLSNTLEKNGLYRTATYKQVVDSALIG